MPRRAAKLMGCGFSKKKKAEAVPRPSKEASKKASRNRPSGIPESSQSFTGRSGSATKIRPDVAELKSNSPVLRNLQTLLGDNMGQVCNAPHPGTPWRLNSACL